MIRRMCGIVPVIALLAATGCGPGFKAPAAPGGTPMILSVFVDRGLDGKTEDQQNQLNQLCEWMENDLLRMARQGGYDARLVGPGAALELGPDHYLINMRVLDYNPGSKAARMVVGFGAGSASLDLHYELRGPDPTPILSREHGRASSKDWKHVARRLNQDMMIAVSDAISGH